MKGGETIKAGDIGGYVEKEKNLSHDGDAWVGGDAKISGNAKVDDFAKVYGNTLVYGAAKVCGDAKVYGDAEGCGDAEVCCAAHILTIGAIGSRNATTTFFRDKNNEITVACGCFLGNIEAFLKKVEETHGDNKHGRAYKAAAELAKIQIDLTKEG